MVPKRSWAGALTSLATFQIRGLYVSTAVLLLGVGVLGVLHSRAEVALTTADQFRYATVARNVARGQGVSTNIVYPFTYGVVPRVSSHPELYKPPGYSVVAGLSMMVLGKGDQALIAVSETSYLVLGVLVAWLGAEIDSWRAGLVAGVLTLLSSAVATMAITGFTALLFSMLVVGGFLAVYRRENAAIVGGLFALAYLVRHNVLFVLPVVGVFLLYTRERPVRAGGGFVGGFAAVSSPWWVRNTLVAGSPLFSLQKYMLLTDVGPFTNLRSFGRQFTQVPFFPSVVEYRGALLSKWFDNLGTAVGTVAELLGSSGEWIPLVALGILGLTLVARKGDYDRSFVVLLLVAWTSQTVFLAAFHVESRYSLPVLPLLFLFVAIGVSRLGQEIVHERHLELVAVSRGRAEQFAVTVVVVLLLVPQGSAILAYEANDHYDPYKNDLHVIRSETEPDALIATERVSSTAWYGNRTSVLLPRSYASLVSHFPCIDYLYVRPSLFNNSNREYSRRQVTSDFRLVATGDDSGLRLYERRPAGDTCRDQ